MSPRNLSYKIRSQILNLSFSFMQSNFKKLSFFYLLSDFYEEDEEPVTAFLTLWLPIGAAGLFLTFVVTLMMCCSKPKDKKKSKKVHAMKEEREEDDQISFISLKTM